MSSIHLIALSRSPYLLIRLECVDLLEWWWVLGLLIGDLPNDFFPLEKNWYSRWSEEKTLEMALVVQLNLCRVRLLALAVPRILGAAGPKMAEKEQLQFLKNSQLML